MIRKMWMKSKDKTNVITLLGCLLCVVWRPQRITLKVGIFAGSNWDVPNGDCYKIIDQAIERYEEENPDIHIEYESGILKDINALSIAKLSESLGAGRKNKDDDIDYNAGVVIKKEIGDEIREGDVLASLYTNIDNPKFNLERIFEIS